MSFAVVGSGCHVLTGVADLEVLGAGGVGATGGMGAQATGADGGGGSSTVGGGGVGAAPECTLPAECPGNDKECEVRSCEGGLCGTLMVPAGEPCIMAGGEVCDGAGKCVECVSFGQCEPMELCDANKCVPGTCVNGVLDPGETGTDCGGLDCAPCINGQPCLLPSDCTSAFCNINSLCAPCGGDIDCLLSEFCDPINLGGSCTLKKAPGDICGAGNECMSGQCPPDDLVCCSATCDAACEACLMVKTGELNGTCAQVLDWTDPDNDCAGQPVCDPVGGGACALKPLGVPCGSDNQCATNECVDGVCCEDKCDSTCQACNGAATGQGDGQCSDVLDGLDPRDDCPGVMVCDGNGDCKN